MSNISLQNLATTITLHLNSIWDSIEKPNQVRDQSVQSYFNLEFESLPHLRDSEQYHSRVDSLRSRFIEEQNADYLFRDAYPSNVPLDGLEIYLKSVWVSNMPNFVPPTPTLHSLHRRQLATMNIWIFPACMSFLQEPCAARSQLHCYRTMGTWSTSTLPFWTKERSSITLVYFWIIGNPSS